MGGEVERERPGTPRPPSVHTGINQRNKDFVFLSKEIEGKKPQPPYTSGHWQDCFSRALPGLTWRVFEEVPAGSSIR
eukprot:1887982-Rhodomonas_salina.1